MNYALVYKQIQELKTQVGRDQNTLLDAMAMIELRLRAQEHMLFSGGFLGLGRRLMFLFWPKEFRKMLDMVHDISWKDYHRKQTAAQLKAAGKTSIPMELVKP